MIIFLKRKKSKTIKKKAGREGIREEKASRPVKLETNVRNSYFQGIGCFLFFFESMPVVNQLLFQHFNTFKTSSVSFLKHHLS